MSSDWLFAHLRLTDSSLIGCLQICFEIHSGKSLSISDLFEHKWQYMFEKVQNDIILPWFTSQHVSNPPTDKVEVHSIK